MFSINLGDGKKVAVLNKLAENECCAVCMICWDKYICTMSECIILTRDYNPSNCKSHLRHSHQPEETPELFSDVSTITNTNSIVNSKATKQSSMMFYQPNPVATSKIALSFLYNFFNEANIAIVQTNNVHLSAFINYLLDNATQLLKKRQECTFSKYKYMIQRDDRYLKFVSSLRELVMFSRDHYNTKLSKNVPFLCVSHDGWDSLEHDVLGVSLHFIIPVHWKVINVAVGLKRIRSKKSIDTCNAILIILKRYVYYVPLIFYFRNISNITSITFIQIWYKH